MDPFEIRQLRFYLNSATRGLPYRDAVRVRLAIEMAVELAIEEAKAGTFGP